MGEIVVNGFGGETVAGGHTTCSDDRVGGVVFKVILAGCNRNGHPRVFLKVYHGNYSRVEYLLIAAIMPPHST